VEERPARTREGGAWAGSDPKTSLLKKFLARASQPEEIGKEGKQSNGETRPAPEKNKSQVGWSVREAGEGTFTSKEERRRATPFRGKKGGDL